MPHAPLPISTPLLVNSSLFWALFQLNRPTLLHINNGGPVKNSKRAKAVSVITYNSVSRHNVNLPSRLANTEQAWIILLDILKIYGPEKTQEAWPLKRCFSKQECLQKAYLFYPQNNSPTPSLKGYVYLSHYPARYLCWLTVYSASLPRPILWWHNPI